MKSRMFALSLRLAVALAAGTYLSVASIARADDDDKDALKGPKVRDQGPPGERRGLSGDGRPERRDGQAPAGAFFRAVASLHGEKAPQELRLSDDQWQEVTQIRDEFFASLKTFRDEHKDEVKGLLAQLPPQERRRAEGFLRGPEGGAGGPGGEQGRGRGKDRDRGSPGGPPDDEVRDEGEKPDPAQAEAAKARLREIMKEAPKPTQAHQAVLAVLTEAQQQHVRTQVEEFAKQGSGRPPGDARERLSNLSPEEREKLKSMSPEERRAYMQEHGKDQKQKKQKKDE